MQYSKNGLTLTEGFESCRLVAYQDIKNIWTIGYGHTRGVYPGMTITPEQAEQYLLADVQVAIAIVNASVKVPLTQGEFDALVDFVFNVGGGNFETSTMLRQLNAGNYQSAAAQFDSWDHASGQVVAGLLRRREAEVQEFNS